MVQFITCSFYFCFATYLVVYLQLLPVLGRFWSAIISDVLVDMGMSENPRVAVGIFKISCLVSEICHALCNFLSASGFSAIFNSITNFFLNRTHHETWDNFLR